MPGVPGSVNLSDQEGTEAPAAQIDGCALCLGSANKLLLKLSEVYYIYICDVYIRKASCFTKNARIVKRKIDSVLTVGFMLSTVREAPVSVAHFNIRQDKQVPTCTKYCMSYSLTLSSTWYLPSEILQA